MGDCFIPGRISVHGTDCREIQWGGEVEYEESITTDSEGNYETAFELSSDQELGDYTVQAEILGTTIEAEFADGKEAD